MDPDGARVRTGAIKMRRFELRPSGMLVVGELFGHQVRGERVVDVGISNNPSAGFEWEIATVALGAIGLLAVQIARAAGAHRVFAVDPAAIRRECAAAHGADRVFDPREGDVAFLIKRATENHGVDVALETSGSGPALHDAIRCLRQCGTVVHVPWGPRDAAALRLDEEFHLNRPTIIGSQAVWDNPDRSHPLWDEARARQAAIQLFRDGLVTGKGIVTPIVPFAEAAQSLGDVFTAPERGIKVGVVFPTSA